MLASARQKLREDARWYHANAPETRLSEVVKDAFAAVHMAAPGVRIMIASKAPPIVLRFENGRRRIVCHPG